MDPTQELERASEAQHHPDASSLELDPETAAALTLIETLHTIQDRLAMRARRFRSFAQGQTDANGNLGPLTVEQTPMAHDFVLTRLVIEVAGFTPQVPYTNAAGALIVRRDGVLVDFRGPSITLPFVFAYTHYEATHYRNGEALQLEIVAGPVAKAVNVRASGLFDAPELF